LSEVYLSIILPVYNEERRLIQALEGLFSFLEKQAYTYEVLLVENGSDDHTYTEACAFAGRYPQLRVMQEQVRGKGLAVRRGMLEAKGEYRFMCDIDFSMPVEQNNRFLPPALVDYDIAMASREAPGAVRYGEPAYRHLVGRVFNLLIRLLALPEYHDTQCGFKCFRGAVADELFACQTIQGWSFDVEVLYIARMRGYTIVEMPIPWFFNPESKVRVFNDSLHMAIDWMHIRDNARKGLYGECDGRQ
jgi:dolichyl-phosphate beta-glucosyltransferase